MELSKSTRRLIGFVLLLLAFLFATLGGGVTWGVTGALWAAGVVCAIYGFLFLVSTSED